MAAPRTLILMRHAAAAGGTRDEDRPLTTGGELAATQAGEWIRTALPPVDAILCSAAARTRQTLAALAIDAPTEYLDELYNGGVDDIAEQIGEVALSVHTVLVIGHAPGIPATAYQLATIDRTPEEPLLDELRNFSAGAIAVLRADTDWPGLLEKGGELVTVRHPSH